LRTGCLNVKMSCKPRHISNINHIRKYFDSNHNVLTNRFVPLTYINMPY